MKNKIKMGMLVCLMIILVLCTGANVFAAGAFVSSPSGNPAPVRVSFRANEGGCAGELVITAYSEKDNLDADTKAMLENAYASIVDTDDLTKLNADLANLVESKNIDSKDLAVSDLFDASVVGCNNHENHIGFNVILKANTLENFVGLLHMNNDGEWELVKDAKVTQNKENIEFSVDSFSPFAIVVNAAADVEPEYIAGDINNNGIVDAKDLTILRRYLAEGWQIKDGEGFVLLLANVDYPKNDIINAEDVTVLSRFISEGWNVELTLPESEALKTEGSVDSLKYGVNGNNSYESVNLSNSMSGTVSGATENASGYSGIVYFCAIVMAVSATALVVILVKNKKNV